MALIEESRRAALSTIEDSSPHSVPICFALDRGRIVTAVDHKPKKSPHLRRLKNISQNENVAVLFDRWDEDWTRLAWVMVTGVASILASGDATAALQARYPQYADDPPRGDVIAIEPQHVRWWSAT